VRFLGTTAHRGSDPVHAFSIFCVVGTVATTNLGQDVVKRGGADEGEADEKDVSLGI
jgi:hypothetical protein